MISKFFTGYSGAFLKSIYIRVNFHKGIFGVISPFKSFKNVSAGIINLLYLA